MRTLGLIFSLFFCGQLLSAGKEDDIITKIKNAYNQHYKPAMKYEPGLPIYSPDMKTVFKTDVFIVHKNLKPSRVKEMMSFARPQLVFLDQGKIQFLETSLYTMKMPGFKSLISPKFRLLTMENAGLMKNCLMKIYGKP